MGRQVLAAVLVRRWLAVASAVVGLAGCVDIPSGFHPSDADQSDTSVADAADVADVADVIDMLDDAADGADAADAEADQEGETTAPADALTVGTQTVTPSVVVGTSSSGDMVLRAVQPWPAVVQGTSEAGGLRLEAGKGKEVGGE